MSIFIAIYVLDYHFLDLREWISSCAIITLSVIFLLGTKAVRSNKMIWGSIYFSLCVNIFDIYYIIGEIAKTYKTIVTHLDQLVNLWDKPNMCLIETLLHYSGDKKCLYLLKNIYLYCWLKLFVEGPVNTVGACGMIIINCKCFYNWISESETSLVRKTFISFVRVMKSSSKSLPNSGD